MTTVADAKRLTKLVRSRHPNLAWVGRRLVQTPVHHILKSIYFEGSGIPHLYSFAWGIDFMFERCSLIHFTCGFPTAQGKSWLRGDPMLDERFAEAIETLALPLFDRIRTIEDLSEGQECKRFFYIPVEKWDLGNVAIHAATGNFAKARALAGKLLAGDSEWLSYQREKWNIERIVGRLCPLIMADDRDGIARLLHETEALFVSGEKLERVWQPTPFPFELQAG
jgi:hypothetical protein